MIVAASTPHSPLMGEARQESLDPMIGGRRAWGSGGAMVTRGPASAEYSLNVNLVSRKDELCSDFRLALFLLRVRRSPFITFVGKLRSSPSGSCIFAIITFVAINTFITLRCMAASSR